MRRSNAIAGVPGNNSQETEKRYSFRTPRKDKTVRVSLASWVNEDSGKSHSANFSRGAGGFKTENTSKKQYVQAVNRFSLSENKSDLRGTSLSCSAHPQFSKATNREAPAFSVATQEPIK